jgi:serine/threonine protein kinase
MGGRPRNIAKTIRCDDVLLLHSLDEGLTEPQEASLAEHLTECVLCRQKLELLAADPLGWSQVGMVLRTESSSEHSAQKHFDDDDFDHSAWKPSDFIVDYLQPSVSNEALGRLGNIEIREFIGQGAHGIVLKGFQEELHRLVAVKVMAPHLASVVAARKRFSREARATAAIVHPNVLPILHVDSRGPLPYLVMPYVDCESLQDRLDREGSIGKVSQLKENVGQR